ncbi:MAG: TIGR03663 family protein [Planctomycetes bacterium]|nr:TIGR03663 family protein [Planctomycetota bacterium]
MNRCLIYVVVFIAVVAALMLRLPRLSSRPMHTDEAVHGIKFGDLLEKGVYHYDKNEYHGPTLNYFTLIGAWISSAKTLVEVDESILRVVPFFFGVCLVFIPLLLMDGLGRRGACFAAILTAVSPAMVFYSRYYIQEMLLVFFAGAVIACGFRYWQCKKVWWLVFAGIFAGLMHATKETCLIAYCSMAGAAVLAIVWGKIQGEGVGLTGGRVRLWHVAVGVAAFLGVSMVLFSSFFSNPQGIVDSVTTYATYFDRAGNNVKHVHPWFYYFKWLVFWKTKGGPVWTEGAIVLLSIIGIITAMTKAKGNGLVRFLAFYTVLMAVVYSAIPYKTPWCLLGFLHGMILLAGFGAGQLLKLTKGRGRVVIVVLLCIAVGHLGYQAYGSSYKYASSWRNPWVYSHPREDIYDVVESVKAAGLASDNGFDTDVRMICAENDYWPLPWYLRAFNRIGYHGRVDEAMSAVPIVIIAAETVDGQIDKLDRQVCEFLYSSPLPGQKNLYVPLYRDYKEIRPLVEVRVYVWKSLYDKI